MLLKEVESEFLTYGEMQMLENPKSSQAKRHISKYLKPSELEIIDSGIEDKLILSIINKMRKKDLNRFKKFDCWHAKKEFLREYIQGELEWVKRSEYFLEGDQERLLAEAREEISPRYRAFFVLKNPEKAYQDREYPQVIS
ncbi:hypothetical protein GF378_03005 [Candidatus Pacearchaeota archaeon]|nr:hypothetical protein [Candidatus Pacearchaeota archaeon]